MGNAATTKKGDSTESGKCAFILNLYLRDSRDTLHAIHFDYLFVHRHNN